MLFKHKGNFVFLFLMENEYLKRFFLVEVNLNECDVRDSKIFIHLIFSRLLEYEETKGSCYVLRYFHRSLIQFNYKFETIYLYHINSPSP